MTRKQDTNCVKQFYQIRQFHRDYQFEPSIGNQHEIFLETWYENIQSFFLALMSQITTFCVRPISEMNGKIKKNKS